MLRVADGNDLGEIEKAIRLAQTEKSRPTLITVRTHIGYGSPKQDTAAAHGEPLGQETLLATKKALGWPQNPTFYVPEEALNHFCRAIQKGAKLEADWKILLKGYRSQHPDLGEQLDQVLEGKLPVNWKNFIPSFRPQYGPMATRNVSGKVMNILSQKLHSLSRAPHHFLIGGSANLAPSTKTILMGYGDFGFSKDCAHNVHYGVREHAMGAIANGMALHSNFIPSTATFLVFSDYMRPAIRLAALMQTHVIFIFTHDSIGLGEDGPTHQPVEQLMSLRTVPGLTVLRPADSNETAIAWRIAIERKGPVVLVFTRQKLPILDPDIILIATGSEVHLALASLRELENRGVRAQVVSMPSWELFEEQTEEYRRRVIPPNLPKLAIEAGSTLGWGTYIGYNGDIIGLDRFGASAPGNVVYEKLGFNIDNVVKRALELLSRHVHSSKVKK